MIDPTVRAARIDDAPELTWLESLARAHLAAQRGGDRWLATHPPRERQWPEVIDGGVFVATIDDVLVGYVVLAVEGPIARIDEVFVHADARELGFGDELLAAALAHARAAGSLLIEGEALPGDRDTKNLYERAGIKARLITVSAPL